MSCFSSASQKCSPRCRQSRFSKMQMWYQHLLEGSLLPTGQCANFPAFHEGTFQFLTTIAASLTYTSSSKTRPKRSLTASPCPLLPFDCVLLLLRKPARAVISAQRPLLHEALQNLTPPLSVSGRAAHLPPWTAFRDSARRALSHTSHLSRTAQ